MIGDIIIANVIASAFLVVLIYWMDINEKEPPWTLVRIYAVSIVLTFVYGQLISLVFKPGPVYSHWFVHFFRAGFCEEFWKLLIVLVFVWPLKSFNDITDGMVYYLIVAAGFTVLENIGYSAMASLNPYIHGMKTGDLAPYRSALTQIVLLRWVSGHIFINGISGVFLGLAKKSGKIWYLLPGFLLSVIIHGLWNHFATFGYLWVFALIMLGVNIWLFIIISRESFYFKFMKRLKERVNDLIREAVQIQLNTDLVLLMESIRDRLGTLSRLESEKFVAQAKVITETLPPNIKGTSLEGEEGLIRRLLRVYGMLGRDLRATGGWFCVHLYLKFVLTGFFLLVIIMRIMIRG